MLRSVLKFGVLGGVVIAVLMSATMPFAEKIGYNKALFVGYSTMVLSFLMVYFGVRSYREKACGGKITFARALGVGTLIMLITCFFYVATWEVIYYFFMPDFFDQYGARAMAKARAAGASEAELAKQAASVAAMKQMYRNPLINAAMTVLEPLPVGLVMALLSAVLLRRREKAAQAAPVS